MKILVVEDEILIADKLNSHLNKLGYNTLEPALDYDEAKESLLKDNPDLAILDVNLGSGKSGIEVANFINQNILIPFIFLTAYQDEGTISEIQKTLPWGYLIKPYRIDELNPAITIALSNYERINDGLKTWKLKWNLLTSSEQQIVFLISKSKSSAEIAEALFVSTSTVKKHRHNICDKLQLSSTNNALLLWSLTNKTLIERYS